MNQKKLIRKLNKAANFIHKAASEPKANWIITSSKFAKLWEKEIKRQERKEKLNAIKKASK